MTPAAVVADHRRPPPPDVRALYPYEPRWIDVGEGQEMAVVDEGPRDAEPVVLVHGNPTWGFLYRHFVPPLLAKGYRVVVPDHVGCGRSSKPADPAYYSLERHTANLERALDAVGVRDATLAVHDWGGPIGLGWAVRHPGLVRRLVILNTLAFAPRRAKALTRWHALFAGPAGGFLGRTLNLVVESAMRFGVARRSRMRGAVLRAYKWPYPTPASRAAPLAFVRMVPTGPDHPAAPAMRAVEDGLARLSDKPAVVLWGDKDPVFGSRRAAMWPERLKGVRRVERFPEGGHFLQEDVHEELVPAMVRFLDETA